MKNIVLIGMPGAGKSTIGVLLAKALNYNFVDTDLLIQKKTGQLLYKTIEEKGLEAFLSIENQVLCDVYETESVIATGGSAIFGHQAMEHLKEDGTIVYLKLSYEEIIRRVNNIKTRGIAMKKGKSMKDVYEERTPLYEKYADVVIDCNKKTIEECVESIFDFVNKQ